MKTNSHIETRTALNTFILTIFISLSSTALASKNTKHVSTKFAQSQAKEVLGKEFKSKNIQSAVKMPHLHHAIYKTVRKSLAKKHQKYSSAIAETLIYEAYKYKFDPVFVMAVIQTESSFNPNAKGSVGEIGLMQIRPETAAWIAEKYNLEFEGEKTLKDPVKNIKIGAAYLDTLRKSFNGFGQKYVAAYNMGARKVRIMTAEDGSIPQEYHRRIVANYTGIYGKLYASASTQRRSMTTEMP